MKVVSNIEMQNMLRVNPKNHAIMLIRQDALEVRVANLRSEFHVVIIPHNGQKYEGMVANYLRKVPLARRADDIDITKKSKKVHNTAPFTEIIEVDDYLIQVFSQEMTQAAQDWWESLFVTSDVPYPDKKGCRGVVCKYHNPINMVEYRDIDENESIAIPFGLSRIN